MARNGDSGMKKKIILKGPLLTRSGYGEQTRFALRSLRSRPDLYEVYIQPLQWGQTSWIAEASSERKWIDDAIEKTIIYIQEESGKFDESLQVTIPNEWENMAPVNIGYTAGMETTKVAYPWIQAGNAMDSIIVVSNHSKKIYQNTVYTAKDNNTGHEVDVKLSTAVESVGYPVKEYKKVDLDLKLDTDFNFLNVTQWSIRKNLELTMRWFVEEFHNENVGLVLKTNLAKNNLIDREETSKRIKHVLADFPDRKCKVYLIHGEMTDEEIHSLYSHPKINAMVSLAHGEGFGLPLFEAAYSGLPIITVGWSGHVDFLVDEQGVEHFYNVSYDMNHVQEEAVWKDVLIKESMWAYAREGSYKKNLRQCYEDLTDPKTAKKTLALCDKYAKELKTRFSEEKMYAAFISAMSDSNQIDAVPLQDVPKISLITSVFDSAEHIEQLMEDVTRQTIFEDKCEWVILNANTPENNFEEEVILKYAEKYPNIIYQRLKEDPGVYGVWNKAIELSTGDYITNVNCDDRRAPWAIEHQAKALITNPDVDLVYNDSYITKSANTMWENVETGCERYNFESFSKEAMLRGNLPHNNPMWRRTLHDTYGMFDDKYKSAGDWEFWLRCSFGGAKFKKYSDILGVYYFNPNGISTNEDNFVWKQAEEKEVFKKYFTQLNQPPNK
jgi:glycosyltransferase involved in cell wall biosynthesis|tara:strand:- start:49 stop:2052 length:2004 start_codon:yes stop_codon:yes gene_type:complete